MRLTKSAADAIEEGLLRGHSEKEPRKPSHGVEAQRVRRRRAVSPGRTSDNAYRLRRRRQNLFGPSSQAFPEFYTPRQYSKSFVVHLEPAYAQSHPDEDFAETFAVWMTPGSEWAKRYAGWPVLKKLEYVDEIMRQIGRQAWTVNENALP